MGTTQLHDRHGRAPALSPLRRLIRDRQVGIVLQPIVDLSRGAIIAYEALTRPGPDTGFGNPMQLFDAAVRERLLWELEEVTRRACLEAAADWPDHVKLFVNCTPEVFGDERFVGALQNDLGAGIEGAGPLIRPDRLVVEITEQSEEQHVRGLRAQLGRLRELGVEIAIDDVGVGTSGLSRIMALRPQWLKLDREFVQGIHKDAMKQNLVRFFVHFAGLSGVNVIAEGVEEREELAALIGLGIRFGQGYYLGKPAPRAAALDPLLAADVQANWASAASGAVESIQTLRVARLCRPAMLVQSSATTGDVLTLLGREPDFEGAIVFDGRRCIGSCSRAAIGAAVRWRGREIPISSIATEATSISPDSTLAEALQVIVSRRDDELASPLVVADGAEITGVLTIRDVLRAAAAVSGTRDGSRSTTGLAGPEDADRHLAALIGSAAAAPGSASPNWDAAFIDIRRFANFTGIYGAKVGQALVDTIGGLILETIAGPGGTGGGAGDGGIGQARAWHLGDDRFMVLAPSPGERSLESRLRAMLQRFDTSCSAFGCSLPGAAVPPQGELTDYPKVSLRVLLIRGVLARVRVPGDLFRLEHQLRQRSRRDEQAADSSGSLLIADHRIDRASVRLSA